MLVIPADLLRALVPMQDAIAAVRQGFMALSAGRAVVPVRTALTVPDGDAVLLTMPGAVAAARGPGAAVVGAKLVTLFPGNDAIRLPLIHAAVVLFDGADGRPLALVEGASLTALRTGAATGLATDLLALPEAGIVALFGAGVQARTQLEAVCTVRLVTQVRVVDRAPDRAHALAAWARAQPWIRDATVLVVTDPDLAVRGAEIVVTATTSPTPVFPGLAVAAGTHVNAVGAFRPEAREVDSALVGRAALFVDSRAAALAEAGDLLIPMREGVITPERIRAEIGEVASGRPGREDAGEITLFKSLGNAVQDLMVASLAADRALATGAGVEVPLQNAGGTG